MSPPGSPKPDPFGFHIRQDRTGEALRFRMADDLGLPGLPGTLGSLPFSHS